MQVGEMLMAQQEAKRQGQYGQLWADEDGTNVVDEGGGGRKVVNVKRKVGKKHEEVEDTRQGQQGGY